MSGSWRRVVLAIACSCLPGDLLGVEPASFSHCESRLAAIPETPGPGQQEAVLCVYEAASAGGAAAEGLARLAELARERPDLGWPPFYAASLLWGDFQPADQQLEEAIRRFVRARDLRGEALARGNRQMTLYALGEVEAAGREAELAVEAADQSGDLEALARSQTALARHLLSQSIDLERAYELLADLVVTLPADAPYPVRRDVLANLARAAIDIGRPAEARSAFRRLLELASDVPDAHSESVAWYGLTRIAAEEMAEAPGAAQRERTVELASRALVAAESAGNHTIASRAHWMLGTLGVPADRRGHLERCAALAPTPRDESYCLAALARHLTQTDPSAAQLVVERSLSLSEAAGDPISQAFAEREQMRVAWAIDPPAEAIAASWRALDAVESLRDRQSERSVVQAGLFSAWSDDYAWLAGRILKEAGDGLPRERGVAEAFLVNERMRARALIDWLREAGPEVADTTGGEFSKLEHVQAALEPREALLSFQVSPWEDLSGDFGGGSWAIAVTRDGVAFHRLPGRVEVRRAVKLIEGLLERRDRSEAGLAAILYERLLAPALAGLPPEVERLILVPDDALHRLPFAALRASAHAEPLGARYELVQVPSATLWLDWRRAQVSAPGRPLLVLADPELPMADPAADPVEVKVAKVWDAAGALGRLPHARREGRAAVKALGDGLLLMGGQASEAQLGSLSLRDFGLIHFAAHAVTDEDRPERSAVLLAAGGAHDGLLQSAEIAGLDLAGRTVVLASCRSASGSVLRGEGVMSLGRAFFQAGAHGVVASLWPLRDDESAALFDRFYRRLAEGATVGEALQGARREAIAAGEPAAAWAGLVVLGDGSLVPVPGGRRAGVPATWWWVAVLLIVVVGALAGWVAIRRFRAFRLVRVPGGGVRAGIDLDRPRELDVDEDEAAWSRRE